MKPTVYLETTIVSYLAARPSRDLITAANQQLTHDWWEKRRVEFELLISPAVLREARRGDPAVAARRVGYLSDLPLLDISQDVQALAVAFIDRGPLPEKAAEDALHIAIAAVHQLDYLLTWNCTHIANAEMRTHLVALCEASGYRLPVICTPAELMGE